MLPIISGEAERSRRDIFHPAVKVLWLGAVCTVALASHRPTVLVVVLALLWGTSLAVGLAARSLWQVTRLSLPFCVAIAVLQVLFRQEGQPLTRIAEWAIYTGALAVAPVSVLRILCLALVGAQFWSWTHPTDLALMLQDWGIPYRYAFLPTLAFRAFPLLSHELAGVLEGQQLLGIDMQRAWGQITHFPQLFIPFCTTTLSAGNDMALALELRGFGSQARRTHLRTLTCHWWDYLAGAVCVAAIGVGLLAHGL